MAKQKTRSPQRTLASLPPGLPNHGNTCFMNSVLQGLIATHYLRLLVRLQPLPTPIRTPHIAARHAPALAPPSDRTPHPSPVAGRLLALLRIAWDIQDARAREFVSPKDVLAALGAKYDQYLDFCQQDAHEFFCHLLDAIRMEETDIIKQRSSQHTDLASFVDMLFGGKLASILVCQACKHVSHTYEDFADLSLSIKHEDYVRERKRDKLKQLAKKLGTAFYVATPRPRSSSVPATPVRTSNLDSPEHHADSQRRRSVDLADADIVLVEPVPDKPVPVVPSPDPDTPSVPATPTDLAPHPVPALDHVVPTPQLHDFPKDRKDRDESWAKISRRITESVGLARRPKPERKYKNLNESTSTSTPATSETGVPPDREPTPLSIVNERLQAQITNVKRSVQRSGNSPLGTTTPRFSLISRPSSPGAQSKSSKSSRPPKLSIEEAAYLRDILADINPPNVQKPFSIFKQSKDPSSSSTQNIFLKLNQINRIEECLRLFTSVEVLDGDNTVRCHRCWKIANGFYNHRARGSAQDPDSCTDSEEDHEAVGGIRPPPNRTLAGVAAPAAVSSSSTSRSSASLQDTHITRDTQQTQLSSRASSTHKNVPPALQLNDGQVVSPIPINMPTARPVPVRGNTATTCSSLRISLSAPSDPHRKNAVDNIPNESEISEGESETLLSLYSDVSSVASTSTQSSHASQEHIPPTVDVRTTTNKIKKDRVHPSGVPRSRQYVLRPAYKRYLIATPPPILVIHLKRFQQTSKAPIVSFSTGFRKLDDYVSFPEHLDLAPYLAPRQEDYFDSKVAVGRGRTRRPTPCMYRLYAVVVHIGNMLGGHYVAYTALPLAPSETRGEATTPPPPEAREPAETAPRDWAFISDTHVRLASLEEVLKSKAYMCMYERV